MKYLEDSTTGNKVTKSGNMDYDLRLLSNMIKGGNRDCFDCVDCIRCDDCVNCRSCDNCVSCEDCDDCDDCVNCYECSGCSAVRDYGY